MSLQFFDAATIDNLKADSAAPEQFIISLVQNQIHHYIDNIHADIYALKIDQLIVPIIAAHEEYDNAYVCSPYGHYISYGKSSTNLLKNQLLAPLARLFIHEFGRAMQRGQINSIVYVNNWLFSTDLHPEGLSKETLSSMITFLKERFPKHAIAFRSLNPFTNSNLIQTLKEYGFQTIPSRQIYLTDTKNDQIFQTRILKSDLKLLRETSLQLIDETQMTSEERQQSLELYHNLNLIDHSPLNPQFNDYFLKLALEKKLLNFKAVKTDGRLCGIAGYLERHGIMLCPFFGYDKKSADHTTIYRMLSTSLLLQARQKQQILHQSAGASFYKTIRRAKGYLESMAVYTEHLPFKQRISWKALQGLVKRFAPAYMQRY